jgi:cytochrome c5
MYASLIRACAGGVAALLLVAPAQAQTRGGQAPVTAASLPAGEGRDLVAVACSQCHVLNVITSMRNGPTGWRDHVYNMVMRGAQLTPREADTVLAYLATNFGPGQQLPPAKPIALPAGAGKELTETRCGLCHDLERITATKRPKREWNDVVAAMFARYGAPAPDEAKAIASYLGQQFGSD